MRSYRWTSRQGLASLWKIVYSWISVAQGRVMYITLESFFRGSICGVLLELMRTKQRNVAKCRSGNGTSELILHGSVGARGTKLLCNYEEFLENICGGLAETTADKLIVMFSK
ncbi:uncharacterized protein LOC108826111 isoform X3 [Raphanus sativus]|uniref:Uncharacterized protein LOC108826111 isoform X3 n=1 Tax=Raphanus sativus TaxID=3726 RepID=A0A9W3CIF1_RAPSA|nr:uncharacterized protein LOC108826111 isoform X3 [Raphanus sativus]